MRALLEWKYHAHRLNRVFLRNNAPKKWEKEKKNYTRFCCEQQGGVSSNFRPFFLLLTSLTWFGKRRKNPLILKRLFSSISIFFFYKMFVSDACIIASIGKIRSLLSHNLRSYPFFLYQLQKKGLLIWNTFCSTSV